MIDPVPTTSLLRKRKKRPSVGSTVICPPTVTTPPATVTTVATSAYSLSMSCTACCRYTMIDVGILGNDTTAVKPWFWLYVAFPYGMEAGEDFAEATNASATSGCGMMNCPASDCMGEDVEVMVYAIAYMPLSGLFPCGYLSTAVMATLVTLKFALADTPTTVMSAPTTGMFPERIFTISSAVAPIPKLCRTTPCVGPVRSFHDPQRYTGVPGYISFGEGL